MGTLREATPTSLIRVRDTEKHRLRAMKQIRKNKKETDSMVIERLLDRYEEKEDEK